MNKKISRRSFFKLPTTSLDLEKTTPQSDANIKLALMNRRHFMNGSFLGILGSFFYSSKIKAAAFFNLGAFWKSSNAAKSYVDDVFSAYLYTGNDTSRTITNGIDLAGKGGLVWIKCRSNNPEHILIDTKRGVNQYLESNSTNAVNTRGTYSDILTAFNSTGFNLGANAFWVNGNTNTYKFASWTFRRSKKFFDVVTYAGSASAQSIAHSLGVAPGMILVKRTDTAGGWYVYHQSMPNTSYLELNTTAAMFTGSDVWSSTTPTASVFTIGTSPGYNTAGGTYVAYLFAHDSITDGIIQCGTFIGTSSGGFSTIAVTLGWEPQLLLIKNITNISGDTGWHIYDMARGMTANGTGDQVLYANTTAAESSDTFVAIKPTGFTYGSIYDLDRFIYMAIRRPNKTPALATQVFQIISRTAAGASTSITGVGFTPDLIISKARAVTAYTPVWFDRMRGLGKIFETNGSAEASNGSGLTSFDMDGYSVNGSLEGANYIDSPSGRVFINYAFRRAPGFMDIVSYIGQGTSTTIPHGLGVAPELMIIKCRSSGYYWAVWHSAIAPTKYLALNTTAASATDATCWNSTVPTATVFSVGTAPQTNSGAETYVAYLFATLAGISKVGSYTGNGGTQTIACGFNTGARFILIKREDSTGDWLVWDTVRGISAGNDPHFSMNTTSPESTTDNSVDTHTSGFIVNQVVATNINVTSANYIFLAIA